MTRWLTYVSIFGHGQQWKLSKKCNKLDKVSWLFCWIRNKPSKICQKLVKFCQSGGISSNLVTMLDGVAAKPALQCIGPRGSNSFSRSVSPDPLQIGRVQLLLWHLYPVGPRKTLLALLSRWQHWRLKLSFYIKSNGTEQTQSLCREVSVTMPRYGCSQAHWLGFNWVRKSVVF